MGSDSAKRSGSTTLEREGEKLVKNSINFHHPACLGKSNLISSKIIRLSNACCFGILRREMEKEDMVPVPPVNLELESVDIHLWERR